MMEIVPGEQKSSFPRLSAGKGRMIGLIGALWGIGGISLLLVSAIYRLSLMAIEGFHHDFGVQHWTSLGVIVFLMAYAEGYKGFQKRFSPRAAARARYLREHPSAFHSLLAPLFCMGFIHATARRRAVSLGLTAGIVLLVILVRLVPQPWRGIVDTGVVIGLLWGLFTLLFYGVQALTSGEFAYPAETPDETQ